MMPKTGFLKFSTVGFLLAGFVFLLGNESWFPDFYAPKFFAGASFLTVLAILLPRWIFAKINPARNSRETLKTVADFQNFLAFSLILNGLGSLGLFQLYKMGFEYDKIIHFATGLLMTFALAPVIFYWRGTSFKKSVIFSAILIFFAGIGWEVLEFLSDFALGTKTLGVYGMRVKEDTIMDLVSNLTGISAAILALSYKHLTRKKESI